MKKYIFSIVKKGVDYLGEAVYNPIIPKGEVKKRKDYINYGDL